MHALAACAPSRRARAARSSNRSHRRPWFRLELLETRLVLSAPVPAGPAFQVNQFTDGGQYGPSVAADADFVLAWESYGQDAAGTYGVYARRYTAAGAARGSEFRVNNTTAGEQNTADVAVDADGDFVVVWQSYAPNTSDFDVYARRFNASGVAQGREFRVNTTTGGDQRDPAVAVDADGDFVVAWYDYGYDEDGVYVRRYSAAGVPQGGEVRVTGVVDSNTRCDVAVEADGDFVVVWNAYDFGDTEGEYGVYARRYSAAGAARGAAFLVTPPGSGDAYSPAVAVDGQGGFVVAWNGYDPDDPFSQTFARRFSPTGTALGAPFPVSTTAGVDEGQDTPAVSAWPNGGFVVAWETYSEDPDVAGVYARQYDAAGRATGDDFRVSGDAAVPSVAAVATGGFMIAWSGIDTADDSGAFAQRFVNEAPIVPARVVRVLVGGPPFTGANPSAGQQAFRNAAGADGTYGYPMPAGASQSRALPWVGGVQAVSIRFDRDVSGQVGQGDLVVRGAAGVRALTAFSYDAATRTATWTLAGPAVTGDRLRLVLDDAGIEGLDGEWADGADAYPSGDGTVGGDFSFGLNVLTGDATGDGAVNALDLSDVKRRFGRRPGDGVTGGGAYSVFADLTGDGQVNALDLAAVRQRLGRRLPALQVPASASAGPGITTPLRPGPLKAEAREELFGGGPIVG